MIRDRRRERRENLGRGMTGREKRTGKGIKRRGIKEEGRGRRFVSQLCLLATPRDFFYPVSSEKKVVRKWKMLC